MIMRIVFAIIVIFSISNCNLTDNDSYNPAYILIDEVSLNTTFSQGDNVFEISEVFIFADGISLGVYPLPAKIPLITSGNDMTILIGGAVHPNGKADSSIEYPFFERVAFTENFEPGKEYNFEIDLNYVSTAIFDFAEGFENGNIFTKDLDSNGNTALKRTNDSNTGNYAGEMTVTPEHNQNEVSTTLSYPRENNSGGATFIEFDYKNEVEFVAGITYQNSLQFTEEPIILLKPTNTWKRIYLDVTSQISLSTINEYSVLFGIYHNGSSDEEQKVLIDNVKLVHF
jgi:hypothetical protein